MLHSLECCKGAKLTVECLKKKIKNKIRTTALILLKTLESLTFGLYIILVFLFLSGCWQKNSQSDLKVPYSKTAGAQYF